MSNGWTNLSGKLFSLILASRERLLLLGGLLDSLLATTASPSAVEVLVVFDIDDASSVEAIGALESKYAALGLRCLTRTRSIWLHRDYINWAFQQSTGKYILVLNDDTQFVQPHWDELAYKKLEEFTSRFPDGLVYGITETLNYSRYYTCFPLLSRKTVEVLGFVLPNERPNWNADVDICQILRTPTVERSLDLPEIKIQHICYHTGSRGLDAVNREIKERYVYEFHSMDQHIRRLSNHLYAEPVSYRVLAVYNICGIAGAENADYYLTALDSLLAQRFDGLHVAVSGCMTSESVKKRLLHALELRNVSFNWISEALPLNVTFNHTVQQCVQRFGSFRAYWYLDSGINLGADRSVLARLYGCLEEHDLAMCSAQVDSDGGYDGWGIQLRPGEHYAVRPGKTCHLHCHLYSHALLAYYGRLHPDIFASDTTESVFPYLNAALGKRWFIARDVKVHHEMYLDGASSGFRHKSPLLFRTGKTVEQICQSGKDYGFGYEECKGVCNHNPAKFDNQGNSVDNRLGPFLRDNLYLSPEEFDYQGIRHDFQPHVPCRLASLASPQVTCVLVSHNKPDYVRAAIQSVLAQKHQDWELIIMDSGLLLSQGYFHWLTDRRIQVVGSKESTVERSLRAMGPWCFNECKRRGLIHGSLIRYLCDDDVLYPNCFTAFVDYARRCPWAQAMYASIDLSVLAANGEEFLLGERRAGRRCGQVIGAGDLDGDYLQVCHHNTLLHLLDWPEQIATAAHSDRVFLQTLGKFTPLHPIDVKIGKSRRTPLSTYRPAANYIDNNA